MALACWKISPTVFCTHHHTLYKYIHAVHGVYIFKTCLFNSLHHFTMCFLVWEGAAFVTHKYSLIVLISFEFAGKYQNITFNNTIDSFIKLNTHILFFSSLSLHIPFLSIYTPSVKTRDKQNICFTWMVHSASQFHVSLFSFLACKWASQPWAAHTEVV